VGKYHVLVGSQVVRRQDRGARERRDEGKPTLETRGERGGITSKEKYSANKTKPTALYMYIITNARIAVCRQDPKNCKTSHVSA
jgi:hypothetical protein